MKLENQVCSLEQAKRLKELGIEAKSLFYFHDWDSLSDDFFTGLRITYSERPPGASAFKSQEELKSVSYPAFTVAELGVMLPPDYQWSWPMMSRDIWVCAYCDVGAEGADSKYEQEGRTEAEARANMLIHLLESGKFTAEESIQRLNA